MFGWQRTFEAARFTGSTGPAKVAVTSFATEERRCGPWLDDGLTGSDSEPEGPLWKVATSQFTCLCSRITACGLGPISTLTPVESFTLVVI
jgi:hypothetical protein